MEVLRVKNISKSIKNKQIINEISFDISEGQIVGLLGPNGAGKTTTFYSILGLIKIDSGEVFLDNKNITMIPPHKFSKANAARLSPNSATEEEAFPSIKSISPLPGVPSNSLAFEL